MENENYLKKVREQYENYPYPKRDPNDEPKSLYHSPAEELNKLNHYCFNGDMPLYQKGEGEIFRVLIAGGGTGDACIHFAEQFREFNAEVVYLDMSQSSMEVAKERAKVRKLTNIKWIHNSLLELPNMDIGTFHYINCTGVLHHLSSPIDGLNALKSVLKDNGAMGIMVYGLYGRTPIYQIQNLMKMVNKDEKNIQTKVDNTKNILDILPSSHWYKLDEKRWKTDVEKYGDIGIYDLFLHSQDRAYSVPQLYEFIEEQGGLKIVEFKGQFNEGKLGYRPETYIRDKELLQKIKKLPKIEQQSIAELMAGSLRKHSIYVATNNSTIASPNNLDLVPYFTHPHFRKIILSKKKTHLNKVIEINIQNDIAKKGNLRFILLENLVKIVELIDGKRTIKEIFELINVNNEELLRIFKLAHQAFFDFHLILLKSKKFPDTLTLHKLQDRFIREYL